MPAFRAKFVRVAPGQATVAVTPVPCSSAERALVNESTNAFAAPYSALRGQGAKAIMELMFRMRPWPRSSMGCRNALVSSERLTTLTRSSARMSAMLRSANVPEGLYPASFTRTSMCLP